MSNARELSEVYKSNKIYILFFTFLSINLNLSFSFIKTFIIYFWIILYENKTSLINCELNYNNKTRKAKLLITLKKIYIVIIYLIRRYLSLLNINLLITDIKVIFSVIKSLIPPPAKR